MYRKRSKILNIKIKLVATEKRRNYLVLEPNH